MFQIFIPTKIRIDIKKNNLAYAVQTINQYNGVKNLYRTVYNFDKYFHIDTAIVDKIFFDFDPDGENDKLYEVQRLHGYLKENCS